MTLAELYGRLAKAEPSHGGKLMRRVMTRRDGRTQTYWMLPNAQNDEGMEDYLVRKDPSGNAFRAELEKPESQAQLKRFLNGEGRHDFTVTDFAALTGLPPGSQIGFPVAVLSPHSLSLDVKARNLELGVKRCEYSLFATPAGGTLTLDILELDRSRTGHGLGTKMLLGMVREAQRMGIKEIVLDAQRDDDPEWPANGYYTWAILGFDGMVPWVLLDDGVARAYRRRSGKRLSAKVKTVQQLLSIPHGREAWKEAGGTMEMKMDLTPGAAGVTRLEQYAKERGYVEG